MTRKELAEAMRRGAATRDVAVNRYEYINLDRGLCLACALGCALIGKYDGDYRKARDEFNQKERQSKTFAATQVASIADLLGISAQLADDIEMQHLGRKSIEQIAAWLESEQEGL